MKKIINKKTILIFIIFLLLIFSFVFDVGMYVTLESLQKNADILMNWVSGNYILSIIIFSLVYIIVTALSLPIATLMTLIGGFLYGSVWGTLFVVISATMGAYLAYLAAKFLFHDFFEKKFSKQLDKIDNNMSDGGFSYLLFLRLVPIFPFFLVNILPAFTRIKISTYLVTTLFGIIPGTFVYVYAGRQLGSIEKVSDIASPGVLSAFVFLGFISLIPNFYKKYKNRNRNNIKNDIE